MTCKEVVEKIAWLMNGTLEASERAAVLKHLGWCESCARELEEMAEVWGAVTQHIPTTMLVDMGLGLPIGTSFREAIERHLSLCPWCREELDLVAGERFAHLLEERRAATRESSSRVHLRGWQRLSIAAGIVASLGVAGWLSQRAPRSEVVGLARESHRMDDLEGAVGVTSPLGDNGGSSFFRDGFESGGAGNWTQIVGAAPGIGLKAKVVTESG